MYNEIDDLISRQAAIDAIEKTGLSENEKDTAIRVIEVIPSAQKHGKWVHDDFGWHCSECLCTEETPNDIPTDYCLFCGAKNGW